MKTLSGTFLAMLFVNTIGALDPFHGKVYLPSPRQYLATFTLWIIFGFAAAFGGPGVARVVGRLSVVTLLAGAFIGPFGGKTVGFLNDVTKFFPSPKGGSS